MGFAATGALVLSACGGSKGDEPTSTAAQSPPPAPAATGDAVAVRSATSGLGDILVGKVTPIAPAARLFTTSSKVVGCSTGNSPGGVPCSSLSA